MQIFTGHEIFFHPDGHSAEATFHQSMAILSWSLLLLICTNLCTRQWLTSNSMTIVITILHYNFLQSLQMGQVQKKVTLLNTVYKLSCLVCTIYFSIMHQKPFVFVHYRNLLCTVLLMLLIPTLWLGSLRSISRKWHDLQCSSSMTGSWLNCQHRLQIAKYT